MRISRMTFVLACDSGVLTAVTTNDIDKTAERSLRIDIVSDRHRVKKKYAPPPFWNKFTQKREGYSAKYFYPDIYRFLG